MIETRISQIYDPIDRFFALAKERQSIFLKKEAGLPAPWTDDVILRNNRFCNVYREQDRTTRWFKKYVRDYYDGRPEVLLATVVFRWFNRITTGEAIFCQTDLTTQPSGATIFDQFVACGEPSLLVDAVRKYCGNKGPYVTGAYMVPSPQGLGLDKLEGIAKLCGDFWANESCWFYNAGGGSWRDIATALENETEGGFSLADVWRWLTQHPFQGPFNAYEVVSDLRHTYLLRNAHDINTWANAGPGAKRGLDRLFGEQRYGDLTLMGQLLQMSRYKNFWPNDESHPAWEMREVEHWLCELSKYDKVSQGTGRMKNAYKVGKGV